MEYIKIYDNVWTPEECLHFISLIDNAERKAGVYVGKDGKYFTDNKIKDSEDVCISTTYPEEVPFILERLAKYVDTYEKEVKVKYLPVRHTESIKGRIYKKGVGKYTRHIDVASETTVRRSLAIVCYLNDITEGGELYFPNQDITVTPKAGRVAMFPPFWMYEHEAHIPISDDRYILRIFATI